MPHLVLVISTSLCFCADVLVLVELSILCCCQFRLFGFEFPEVVCCFLNHSNHVIGHCAEATGSVLAILSILWKNMSWLLFWLILLFDVCYGRCMYFRCHDLMLFFFLNCELILMYDLILNMDVLFLSRFMMLISMFSFECRVSETCNCC